MANQSDERRQRIRRSVDDCSQCDIWNFKFIQSDKEIAEHKKEVADSLKTVHARIDKTLPWKVFLIVVGLYLSIAVYNAVAIKSLAIDVAKVQTKVETVQQNITEVKREIKRR